MMGSEIEDQVYVISPSLSGVEKGDYEKLWGRKPPYQPGDVLVNQFEICRVLGYGGMGVVYEVIDRLTRQRLALKLIRFDLAQKKHITEYFLREVAIARQLRHPYIVAVFDVRKEGDLLFYTMELLQGESLRSYLRRRGFFSIPKAIAIVKQLCMALEHAHYYTVHRDISPENIMITPSGVKLLDFGIAKALKIDVESGSGIGKTYYTAPEQFENSRDVDARADIYSVGVILFELLTGRVPKKPLPEDFSYPGLPAELARIIAKAVAPIERRYTSARELRDALESYEALSCAPKNLVVADEQEIIVANIYEDQGSKIPEGQRHRENVSKRQFYSLIRIFIVGMLSLFILWVLVGLVVPLASRAPLFSQETSPPVTESIMHAESPSVPAVPTKWVTQGRSASLRLTDDVFMGFTKIRIGTFIMGHGAEMMSDYSPAHEVTLSRGFWLGTTEVTQAQWYTVMNTRPWANQMGVLEHPDAPATYVSWNDVQIFLSRLNQMDAGHFRLPTEAEWEFACRAGSTEMYFFGNDGSQLGDYAWYSKNVRMLSQSSPQPVATKLPNLWGLYDMHGNVAEWCLDWYQANFYSSEHVYDPIGPASGVYKVVRGGSWNDMERSLTCYARGKEYPTTRSSMIGFRVCRDL